MSTVTTKQADYTDTFTHITEGTSPLGISHPTGTWGYVNGLKLFLNGIDRRDGTDSQISPTIFTRVPCLCATFGRNGIESNVATILKYMIDKHEWIEFTLDDIPYLTEAGIEYLYASGWLNRHENTYVVTMGLIKFLLMKLAD